MSAPINPHVFYRAFLLALRENVDSFDTYGERFHWAFRGMLDDARVTMPHDLGHVAEAMLENWDPVFGVSPDASAMVLEGIRDLLISLDSPRMAVARFYVTKSDAKAELGGMADINAAHFRQLATDFAVRLKP